jgi:bacteriorhodopsin
MNTFNFLIVLGWLVAVLTLITNGWGTPSGFWISSVFSIVLELLGILGSLMKAKNSNSPKISTLFGVILIIIMGIWMYLVSTGV